MHVFRDSGSIRGAVAKLPEVAPLLSKRIEELSEYVGDDLSSLVNILVVQPRDTLADVDAALGFAVEDRGVDAIESHPAWYELTYVLSDDGFGLVLYVPKRPDIDPRLLDLCASRTGGSTP